MKLEFAFGVKSNLTLFDEKVSAAFDDKSEEKIIAKKDMLSLGYDKETFCPSLQITEGADVAYTLVEKWLDLTKTIVEIDASLHEVGKMSLLQLSHGGEICLEGKTGVRVTMISEVGEEDSLISHDHDLSGWVVIRIFMPTLDRLVIMINDKELFLDLPPNMSKGVQIHGFLGRMADTKASIYSIKTYDISSLDGRIASEVERQLMKRTQAAPQEIKATISTQEEDQAVMDAFNSYKSAQTQEPMRETILQVITRITGLQANEALSLARNELLKRVYNGLATDTAYEKMDHDQLMRETHYLCSQLIEGEQVPVDAKIGLGGKSYRTYEFGEVNDSNVTAERLLYLVKAYPDVWLARLV